MTFKQNKELSVTIYKRYSNRGHNIEYLSLCFNMTECEIAQRIKSGRKLAEEAQQHAA